jgi:NitT/TauT family transport system ATP-binding protein
MRDPLTAAAVPAALTPHDPTHGEPAPSSSPAVTSESAAGSSDCPAGRWLVSMRKLSFAYPNGTQAIDKIDLDIDEGEVVSVIGPSGCGKSTLVAALAGLQNHGGTIGWNDDALAGVDGRARNRLTVVFQRDTVMPWLSVEKNVAFGLRFLQLSRTEKRRRVNELLDMASLTEFRKAMPHQLSGGMIRRVALLAGVAPLPKLLVLDEPFAALDEPTRVGLHRDVLKLTRQLGIGILLVTHDLSEAVSLSDRVVVLTRRPARIASVISVGLSAERDVLEVRSTDAYQIAYQDLWEKLWAEIQTKPQP